MVDVFYIVLFYNFLNTFSYILKFLNIYIIKKTNKDCKKRLVKDIKIILKKKNKKSDNMVLKVTKISKNKKNKSLLSIEKNIVE